MNYVEVTVTTDPEVFTIHQMVYITGRQREQINLAIKAHDLNFSYLFQDEEAGARGIKVVINDEKAQAFIEKCERLNSDKKHQKRVNKWYKKVFKKDRAR